MSSEIINPSVIYGLSSEEYHRAEPYKQYLSSTGLKHYIKSPRYAKYMFDHPDDSETDAQKFGSLFHECMSAIASGASIDAVLDNIVVFNPPINEKTGQAYGASTKAYKEAYDEFLAQNTGKDISTQEEVDKVRAMLHSLLESSGATSAQVKQLLKWAKGSEVSYFYETDKGIKLKVRPDLLTGTKIVDWKTTSIDTLDDDNIARQIIKYRYDVSLSMYQYVLHEITKQWLTPILVFVQKQEPYDAVMCDISDWCFTYDDADDYVKPGIGALEFKRLLDLHTRCVNANQWPGAETAIEADGNIRILKPTIPTWLGYKYYDYDNF